LCTWLPPSSRCKGRALSMAGTATAVCIDLARKRIRTKDVSMLVAPVTTLPAQAVQVATCELDARITMIGVELLFYYVTTGRCTVHLLQPLLLCCILLYSLENEGSFL
jgi:hypothetical protein